MREHFTSGDVLIATALVAIGAAITVPPVLRQRVGPVVVSDDQGDKYFNANQAGVIYYTTGPMPSFDLENLTLPSTAVTCSHG